MSPRQCGQCQLCCRLLPVEQGIKVDGIPMKIGLEFDKPAGQKCPHQKHGVGCAIYDRRPIACRMWTCQWLDRVPGTEDLRRPDHSHYVIDVIPDTIRITLDGKAEDFSVIQVWCDPKYREAHRDPELRKYLRTVWERDKMLAIVRFSSFDALVLLPNPDGTWIEKVSSCNLPLGYGKSSRVESL